MKQKTIITNKVEMLVIYLPESPFFVPHDEWQHLGKATDLTEEDWKLIVDTDDQYGVIMFRNYGYSRGEYFDEQINATESGLSLLKANGVFLENELGEKPEVVREIVRIFGTYYKANRGAVELYKWQEAESKVWRNCHLFIKQK